MKSNLVNRFRLMIWRQVALATIMLLPFCATAAEIETSSDPGCRIEINGAITSGAFQRLVGVLDHLLVFDGESTNGSVACLNSPGGNLIEALMIARLFLEEGVQTKLREGAECMSACAIIFMMGNVKGAEVSFLSRTMHRNSLLGFHRPYLSIEEARSFTRGEIEDAFAFGMDTIYEIMSLATSNTPWHYSRMMEPDLIQKMIGTPRDSIYPIYQVEQALRWQISLEALPDFGPPSPINLISACENALSLDVALTSSRNSGGLLSDSIFDFDPAWKYEFTSLLRDISRVEGTGRVGVESPRSGYAFIRCEVQFRSNHIEICAVDESTSLRLGNCDTNDVEYFGRLISLHPSTHLSALPFVTDSDTVSAAIRGCRIFSGGSRIRDESCLHKVSIANNANGLSVLHTLTFIDGAKESLQVLLAEIGEINQFFWNGRDAALLPSGNCVMETSGERILCSEMR